MTEVDKVETPVVDKVVVPGHEFLNMILEKMWIHMEIYLNSKEVKEKIVVASKGYIELVSLKMPVPAIFHELDLLNNKWSTNSSNECIMLDIHSEFKNIEVNLKDTKVGVPFGVETSFNGELRIVLNHLTSQFLPLFEAFTIYFEKTPELKLDFKDGASVLAIPGFKDKPAEIVTDLLESLMVYPNRMTFAMNEIVDISAYKYPSAYGLLRIQVKEIDHLSGDYELWGVPSFYHKIKCHYGTVQSSAKNAKSKKTGNTEWDQTYEIILTEPDLETLRISFYEDDLTSRDDYVGKVVIPDLSAILFTPQNKGLEKGKEKEQKDEGAKDEEKMEEAETAKPVTTFKIDGDKTGQATILFEFIPFIKNPQDKLKPLKTIEDSNITKTKYYISCHVIKMDISDPKKEKADKDDDISRTFVFACSQNQSKLSHHRTFATSPKGDFKLPLVAEALVESLPESLEFVMAEDGDDIKDSTFLKFLIPTAGFEEMKYAEVKEVKGIVSEAEVLTAVIRVAKLEN